MSAIFKKLNLKDQSVILVCNAPGSFETELAALDNITIHRHVVDIPEIEFSLAFVLKQSEVDELGAAIAQKTKGDAIVWFAYPKGSSKKYKSEITRDTGWAILGELGFEPVRQVAIDADWSALRFRRVQYIKSLTRSKNMAITEQGKQRAEERKQ